MFAYVYELSTGIFLRGGPSIGVPDYDPATEGFVMLDAHPNRRAERYDVTAPAKKRAATAPEIAAFDAARVNEIASGKIDADKVVLALAEFVRQELNTIRAALPVPLAAITRAQALASIRTIYKALP